MYTTAQYLQPFAAVIAGAAFLIPPGVLAGTMAIAWIPAVALPVVDTLRRRGQPSWQMEGTLISGAFVYQLISAVFLWIERVNPASTPADLAAALHLHIWGFGGLLLSGISGQALHRSRQSGLLLFLRIAAPLWILAPLPARWLAGLPSSIQIAAVGIQVLASLSLSTVLLFAALHIPMRRAARALLLIGALAGLEATIAGGAAAAGDLSRAFYFSDSAVTLFHSWPFAAGLILCGLAAWTLERPHH